MPSTGAISRPFALLFVLLVASTVLGAQASTPAQPKPQPPSRPKTASPELPDKAPVRTEAEVPLIVNTDLVAVTVTITDRDGRHFNGLDKSAFSVYDDGELQEVSFFSDADMPISLAIVFDTSKSMSGDKLMRTKDALRQFVATTHREDEYFLISFNERAHLLLDRTGDANAMFDKFTYVQPHGSTALYDAAYLGVLKLAQGTRPKRVLLLIIDGNDNSSRYTLKDLRRSLDESDVILYAVGILGGLRAEARAGRST
ncbi:MAG: VWA domain-containing protein, partial [Pyrinomonadaceae bacterium]